MARVRGFGLADMKINQNDMRRLNQKLKQLNKYSQTGVDEAIRGTAAKSAEIAASTVVVDMGALKQSISYSQRGKAEYDVFASAKYAPYVEFGTGELVDVSDATALGIPAAAIRSEFQGRGFTGQKPVFLKKRGSSAGEWRMIQFPISLPPRPFFFSSVRIAYKMLLQKLERDLKKLT